MNTLVRLGIIGLMVIVFITSCKTSRDVANSSMTMPDSYQTKADTGNVSSFPWDVFYKDSALAELVTRALAHNLELNISSNQVRLVENQYGRMKRNYLPFVDVQVNNRLAKFGEYTMDGVGNDDTNRSDGVPPDKKIPTPYQEWFAGLAFGWEADIWGKLSNTRKAAMARYLSSREMYHLLSTKVVSDIATNYYELVGLDREKKVFEENIKLQKLALELVMIQKAGGKVNQLAVDQFEAQLLNTKSGIVSVDQKILETKAKLNWLMGKFPEEMRRDSLVKYDTVRLPALGHPEDLLRNRPDIRAAEMELSASNFDIKVARAAFYPSLTIGGATGFSTFDIARWLTPGSAAFTIASGFSAPLFQRKQIQRLYEASKVKQKIALAEYEKTLLNAFHEVYVTVANFENLGRQIDLKKSEAEVWRKAFNNSNDLFSVGYANYLEVITAQRRMLEVELELIHLQTEKLKARALLYRALGGGWRKSSYTEQVAN